MTVYISLLRAVNVGGTGKLAMSALVKLCEKAGFRDPETYIQSGNVIFESRASEAKVKADLEKALAAKMKKPVGVLVRSAAELEQTLARNPFADADPKRVLAFFYDEAPSKKSIAATKRLDGEVLAIHGRALFVHFPNGQGRSKLKVPDVDLATGRNLNTVAKLVELARARGM